MLPPLTTIAAGVGSASNFAEPHRAPSRTRRRPRRAGHASSRSQAIVVRDLVLGQRRRSRRARACRCRTPRRRSDRRVRRRASARLSISTMRPAASDRDIAAVFTLCAPTIRTAGATARTRLAHPPSSPPPPTLTTSVARSGSVAEDLECDRPLAGEQHLAEAWIDERRAVLRGERLRRVHRRVVVRLRRVDRRAERGDAVALHLRRGRSARRSSPARRSASPRRRRRVRDCRPTTRRRRARARSGGSVANDVQRAAQLERAGGLLVLELEVDVAAGERRSAARCGGAACV